MAAPGGISNLDMVGVQQMDLSSGAYGFNDLVSILQRMFSAFTRQDVSAPAYLPDLGINGMWRIQNYLDVILPSLFLIIAIVLGIKLAIKVFKKFSR